MSGSHYHATLARRHSAGSPRPCSPSLIVQPTLTPFRRRLQRAFKNSSRNRLQPPFAPVRPVRTAQCISTERSKRTSFFLERFSPHTRWWTFAGAEVSEYCTT
ncbi:hypothetical protein OH77DRAFT_1096103 [Trametes cingulata]|nr:hypothetical protein OH77DRAFT_1096103 [Trametes cingulata]